MLREVKQKTKAKTALMLMPVLPYLTDSENNLDVIFALAKKCPVDYVLVGLLNLIGDTKKHYFQFIEKEFPQLSSKYKALYKRGRIDAEYKKNFFQKVERIRKKYGLPSWTKPTSDNNA
jgi:DNA repair photolyase